MTDPNMPTGMPVRQITLTVAPNGSFDVNSNYGDYMHMIAMLRLGMRRLEDAILGESNTPAARILTGGDLPV